MILNSDKSLTEIALACGYNDHPHFCKVFKKINGFVPSEYKRLRSTSNNK